MKRFLFLVAAALLSVSFAGAQSLTPSAHAIGLGASVSSTNNALQGFFLVTDKIVLEPSVGFYQANTATTVAGSTTNYPVNWYDVGLGAYYVLKSFQSLSVLVGPAFTLSTQNQSSANIKITNWSVTANLQLLAMITKNLGAFTNFGAYYSSYQNKNTANNTTTLTTTFGVQSIQLGVAYFFK